METDSQKDGAGTATSEAANAAPLAALWRRWVAFLIDWIILCLGGFMLGTVLFDPLANLGPWARAVGFAIALVYFGVFDSGWGGAGSPGKKILGIRVVDSTGRVIGMPRSFVRSAMFCAPILLNDFFLMPEQGAWGELALNGLFGGWMIATLYVLAFNRGTKQGLQDLATGTFVVHGRATRLGLAGYAFWRPHLIIAALLIALSIPMSMARLPVSLHFSPGGVHPVTKAPDNGPVAVRATWLFWKPLKAGESGRPECLSARIVLKGTGVDDENVARTVARRLVAHYRCQVVTNLTVRMQYGFELGFASGTAFHDFVIDEADMTRQP